MNNSLQQEFIEQSAYYFNENTPRILKCLDRLTHEQVWYSPNEHTNSIGNLILHLCGNITQYILSSLGGAPDERTRSLEFDKSQNLSKEDLVAMVTETATRASEVISGIATEELLRKREVQCYVMSGMAIIIHVVEHYSYHTGQIALLTKSMTDKDLGFYEGQDLEQNVDP